MAYSALSTHAVIIHEANLCNIESIITNHVINILKQHQADERVINKVQNGQYYDLITFDAQNNSLKKDDVDQLLTRLSRQGYESINVKFYVIKCIENASKQALNALLKTLEEPEANIYAILTTKNINRVLPTIVSRCQVLTINKQTHDETLVTLAKEYELTQEQIKIAQHIYTNLHEFINDLTTEKFQSSDEFVTLLINERNNFTTIKNCSEQFKKFEYHKISLVLKMLAYKIKNNQQIIYQLLDQLHANPVKILIFNQIVDAIN
ncbi:MAG: hypothetical protein LBC33_01190 [Mycoplasmataceae bacterium]|jgi:DNA polymerase-3 subunit delta'|nr:hypothetical protein [Mycoplasmataceae bacterium]